MNSNQVQDINFSTDINKPFFQGISDPKGEKPISCVNSLSELITYRVLELFNNTNQMVDGLINNQTVR